jgi:outer membrane protein
MTFRNLRFSIVALVAAFVLILPARTATAQAVQIGFTDHELIIANMPEYQEIQQQLQQEFQQSQQQLQQRYEEFQEKVQRYQKQQALLSEETRQQRETELQQLQQELQQSAQQSEQQLAQREAEMLSPVYERVDKAIKAVAKNKGLDIVLRNQVGPLQPVILYVNEDTVTDITPDVARRLGLDVDEDAGTASTN